MSNSPPPAPPPAIPDINSEEFKTQFANKQRAALLKASEQRSNVTRKYLIWWEMHFGYFMVPADAANPWFNPDVVRVYPDFLDDRVEAQFDAVNPKQTGKHVVCECTGVEWTFYGQRRFLVRQAKLEVRD